MPTPGPAGYYYADVPNRVIALIIDAIILGIINGVVSAIIGGTTSLSSTTNGLSVDVDYARSILLLIISLAISAAYFVLLWSRQRATVGMRVLGLQIGDEVDGRSITPRQGLIRWLVIGIPLILADFLIYLSQWLGVLLGLVGIIWLIALLVSIAQSPTKQGYHDRYAHTVMVKAARRAG